MSNYSQLTEAEQLRVEAGLFLQIDALYSGRRILEKRLKLASTNDDQGEIIKAKIIETVFRVDILHARINALDISSQPITPPSERKLTKMRENLLKLGTIINSNNTAKEIVAGITKVGGAVKMPKGNG